MSLFGIIIIEIERERESEEERDGHARTRGRWNALSFFSLWETRGFFGRMSGIVSFTPRSVASWVECVSVSGMTDHTLYNNHGGLSNNQQDIPSENV